jgi:hypothetical protein
VRGRMCIHFVLATACFLIFCCLCDIIPRRRVCAKEQSLSRRVFAILFLWMRAVLFMSCVCLPFVVRLAAIEGRALARAVAMSVAVFWRVVPAWPMGIQPNSTRPQHLRRAKGRGSYLSVFSVYF